MSYRAWMAARQLLTEEYIGRYLRNPQNNEDEVFKRGLSNLPRS